MPSQATVTSVIGPGQAITALVFPNVKSFKAVPGKILTIEYVDTTIGPRTVEISLAPVTTFTVSISGSTYTLTIS